MVTNISLLLVLFLISLCTIPVCAQTVAISANAQYVIEDIAKEFRKETGLQIKTVIGSSGTLSAQLSKGAPFDVFLSADTGYPSALWRQGIAADSPRIYAFGTLVMWTAGEINLNDGIHSVQSAGVKKIAVANPGNAPYGVAAIEALTKSGLWKSVESKIIYGESIAQVNQYVDTKNVEIGFTSASVILSKQLRGKGKWREVDRSLYSPIPQAVILLKKTSGPEAQKFYDFIFSVPAKNIFRQYGYIIP